MHTATANELVENYADAVYKFCRSLTYTKEDAEDLFQDTFVQVFAQMAKLATATNPQSFLFSTALYQWKSRKRKYARRNSIAPIAPLSNLDKSDYDLAGSIIAQEEIRLVRELVADLPEKYKAPIALFYTVEMSVAEIAAVLKIPQGTVKSRLHKARILIEKGLKKHGYTAKVIEQF